MIKIGVKNWIRKKVRNFISEPKNQVLTLDDTVGWNNILDDINTGDITNTSEMHDSIYFICMKHLTETMSKMPWRIIKETQEKGKERVYNSRVEYLLNKRPNPYYSAATFWGTTELNKNHFGNSFAYIERDQGTAEIKYLWLLPTEEVTMYVDNAGIFGKENGVWYIWQDVRTGKKYRFNQGEILHFKNSISWNGLLGMSVKDYLRTQVETNLLATGFSKKYYEGNMFGSKVFLSYTADLNAKAVETAISKIEEFSKKTDLSGRFIPIPPGFDAKLSDLKLSDAQFVENNKINALQLAAAFGIKPNVINDYSKSSYANSETQQLDFYINTLQPSFNAYEQEVSYKLLGEKRLVSGESLKINEKILFKMDSKTQAEVYGTFVTNFVMTPNEVREELDLPYQEGADKLLGNGAAIDLPNVGIQYGGGGENDEN